MRVGACDLAGGQRQAEQIHQWVISDRHPGERLFQAGIPVVIVNQGPTRGDDFATVKIDAGCSPVLTHLAKTLPPAAA